MLRGDFVRHVADDLGQVLFSLAIIRVLIALSVTKGAKFRRTQFEARFLVGFLLLDVAFVLGFVVLCLLARLFRLFVVVPGQGLIALLAVCALDQFDDIGPTARLLIPSLRHRAPREHKTAALKANAKPNVRLDRYMASRFCPEFSNPDLYSRQDGKKCNQFGAFRKGRLYFPLSL